MILNNLNKINMNLIETETWNKIKSNKWIKCQYSHSIKFERIAVNLYQNNMNDINSLIDHSNAYLDYLDVYYLVKFIEKLKFNIDKYFIIKKLLNNLIKTRINVRKKYIQSHEKFCKFIIHLIKYMLSDYELLNKFLLLCGEELDVNGTKETWKAASELIFEYKINPLMLNQDNFYKLYQDYNNCIILEDIYNEIEYKEFKLLVDDLTCIVPIPSELKSQVSNKYNQIQNNILTTSDYRKKSSPLFWHNSTLYHGNRDKVYNSILFLKESADILDFEDIITLSGSLDYYLINMYIDSCYSGTINLMMIEPRHMMQFLNFIDQYQTETLSINKLEIDIVDFFDKVQDESYDFSSNGELGIMCEKYKMKCLYLFMHNKNIASKKNIL